MLRDVIKEYRLNNIFFVDEADNRKVALNNYYDLMILDIMLTEIYGFTMLEKLPKDKNIPNIILSACGEEYDKFSGFDLRNDDYLTKTFSLN